MIFHFDRFVFKATVVDGVCFVSDETIEAVTSAANLINRKILYTRGNFHETCFIFDIPLEDEDDFRVAEQKLIAAGFLRGAK